MISLVSRSLAISIQQFDAVGISSMITRATSDIANLQRTMGMVLQLVVPAPIIVTVSVVMTMLASPVMTVIQLVFMAVLLSLAALILKKSTPLSHSIQTRLDRINQVVREAVTGVRVIRAFGNEQYEEKRSGAAYASYADNMIRLNRLFAVVNPVVWLLMGALIAVVLGVGGALSLGGSMEVGQITAVTEYSTLTMAYLIMAASVLTTLPKASANFSGGQRQRLAIARALVRQADVFIFDDSFSALDVKTDAALRKALHRYVTRPAKLIIAQRVITILDADQILVSDNGRLVGIGTHRDLLERCPIYRDIADSQMQRKEA